MKLTAIAAIKQKLFYKYKVIIDEIKECFMNRTKGFLTDTRLDHLTDPPTQWFIAQTNRRRILKIVFISIGGICEIKTAYEPNQKEVYI